MNWFKDWSQGDLTRWLSDRVLGLRKNVRGLHNYRCGELILREGEPVNSVQLVLSGACKRTHIGPDGKRRVHDVIEAGRSFGRRDLMHDGRSRFRVQALEDSVVLEVDAKTVQAAMRDQNELEEEIQAASNHLGRSRGHHSKELPHSVVSFAGLGKGAMCNKVVDLVCQKLTKESPVEFCRIFITTHCENRLDLSELIEQVRLDSLHRIAHGFQKHQEGYVTIKICYHPESDDPRDVVTLINQMTLHYPLVIIEADEDLPTEPLARCLVYSDLSYVMLGQNAQELYDMKLLSEAVRSADLPIGAQLHPVFCLNQDESPIEVPGFDQSLVYRVQADWSDKEDFEDTSEPSPPRIDYPIRTMTREIAGRRIGLALSSGGAKGLAHIGVIQVLEENDYEIDMVAGSSMGAYISSLWAYGISGKEMEQLAKELASGWQVFSLLDPLLWPRGGFIKGEAVRRRLARTIDDVDFIDLLRPCQIVTTCLDTYESTVFSKGNVAQAVHASAAVPGVVRPVRIDGKMYIDGGISQPVPVSTLHNAGMEHVIAVNTLPTPDMVKQWVDTGNDAYDSVPPGSGVTGFLNQQLNFFATGNILDTMLRSVHAAQIRVAHTECQQADIVLSAVMSSAKWTDFGRPEKYIQFGRKVAEEKLDEIGSLFKGATHTHSTKEFSQASGNPTGKAVRHVA